MTNVELLSEYATTHGLDYKRVRRLARKNELVDGGGNDIPVTKFGTLWAIEIGAPIAVLPAHKPRGFKSTRTDGRQRYIVYMADDEMIAFNETVEFANCELVNPRERAKQKRADKKRAADGAQ